MIAMVITVRVYVCVNVCVCVCVCVCASPGIVIINNILRIEFWSTLTFEDPPLPPVDFVFSLSVNLRGHWQWWGARTHKGIGAETALAGDTNRRDKRCMSNLLTGTHMHIVVIDRHSSWSCFFFWPVLLDYSILVFGFTWFCFLL